MASTTVHEQQAPTTSTSTINPSHIPPSSHLSSIANQNLPPPQPQPQPQPLPSSNLTDNTNSNNFSNNINSSSFSNSKKRTLDHVTLLQSSPYFKMRALCQQLRPLFIEVLRAPDIQNCEAGREIQEKMKLMIDLFRQKTVDNVRQVNGAGSLDLASEKQVGQKPVLMSQDLNPADQPAQTDRCFVRPAEERRFPVGNNLEKQTPDGNRIPGTYIVGGSAFGWNFITFHGTKPEYYGRTKEAFRAGKLVVYCVV